MGNLNFIEKSARIAYVVLLLLVAAATYQSRYRDWNWDLLGYLGSAVCSSEADPVRIHSVVFREAKAEIPGPEFRLLVESNAYRVDVANNAFHFAEQIPFYSAKSAYVALIAVLHKSGITRIQSMKLISSLSFVALGIVFFGWTRVYLNVVPGVLLSSIFLLCQPVLTSATTSSPDGLSVATVVSGLYALFERSAELIGLALLCCSVFIRGDNLVLAVMVIGYLSFGSRPTMRIKPAYGVILIGLLLGSVIATNRLGGNYGWQTLVYHSVVQRMTTPAEALPHLSSADYLHALARCGREALLWSSLALVSFLAATSLLTLKRGDKIRDLLLLNFTALLLRLLVYPSFEERYFVSTYVIVAISLVSVATTRGAWSSSLGRKS